MLQVHKLATKARGARRFWTGTAASILNTAHAITLVHIKSDWWFGIGDSFQWIVLAVLTTWNTWDIGQEPQCLDWTAYQSDLDEYLDDHSSIFFIFLQCLCWFRWTVRIFYPDGSPFASGEFGARVIYCTSCLASYIILPQGWSTDLNLVGPARREIQLHFIECGVQLRRSTRVSRVIFDFGMWWYQYGHGTVQDRDQDHPRPNPWKGCRRPLWLVRPEVARGLVFAGDLTNNKDGGVHRNEQSMGVYCTNMYQLQGGAP